MAGPLTPLFIDAAVGVAEKGLDFAMNPQQTMDQITTQPQRILGL